ncbi:hypothetical protein BD408DRAFT_425331 [Parasitella parasitica]|nr:hypothetical protein BD408DRAFT_425331 [Parasitella parasitica]
MLYWPKLLITAFAITNTLEAFIPLYLVNQLQLTALQASFLIAAVYVLRLFSGVWTSVVDHRPYIYGFIISLLTALSSIALAVLLSLTSPTFANLDSRWIWTILIICTICNGLFYQPLGTLIDTAIIKTLGDYRVLFYGSYVRWSKTTTIVMTGGIGLLISVVTEDRYLDIILLGVYMTGMVLLLVIALAFTSVEPANASQLDISDEQAPLLLKNALYLTADQNNIAAYRPYSIFGEQLSHISEEDASQLDRMFTREDSLRPMDSYDSNAPSFYSRNSYMSGSGIASAVEDSYLPMTPVPILPANALALLPLPTPTDPLVAFFCCMRPNQQNTDDELVGGYYYGQQPPQNPKMNQWKTQTLSVTMLLLGIANALMGTFLFVYVYFFMELSIYFISCLIMIHMTCELIVAYIIEKWFIHRLNLTLITTFVHIILIMCAILYPCMKPGNFATHVSLLLLQALQAIAFQLIWLSGADQVNLIHWSQNERMKQRSKISALFSSIGPAIGATLAGYILQSDQSMEDYTLIFKCCVALFSLSFVVSWGWTSEE